MRNRTRLAVLAFAVSACGGLLHGTAAAQQQPDRVRPVPPEEPPPATVAPREGAKREEIESRVRQEAAVNPEDFTGQGVARGRDERPIDREGDVRLGQSVRSELDRTDERADDGSYYEEWFHRGQPGTRVSVSMSSGAFDTFLVWGRVIDGEFKAIAADDDGGEENDSRLTAWIRDDGEYAIRANSYGRATGRYTLLVEEAPARPDPGTPKGDIAPGQSQRSTLGDGDAVLPRGNYYEVWTYRGRAGQRITLSAASDDFDTRLAWAQMVGGEAVALLEDDDGGEGSNSELTVEVEADGEYAVLVSAMSPGQTGAYTLRAEPARR